VRLSMILLANKKDYILDLAQGRVPRSAASAINQSVRKWEFILDQLEQGRSIVDDGGPQTCPLCWFYRQEYTECGVSECGECPIALAGHANCRKTPYEAYDKARRRSIKKRLALAGQEVRFLRTLVPKDPKQIKAKRWLRRHEYT